MGNEDLRRRLRSRDGRQQFDALREQVASRASFGFFRVRSRVAMRRHQERGAKKEQGQEGSAEAQNERRSPHAAQALLKKI